MNETVTFEWNREVKNIIKTELRKNNLTHNDLADLFQQMGINETKASIDSKLSRGSFSAIFFVQCLYAIQAKREQNYQALTYPLTFEYVFRKPI